jgi:hypothetical protein
MAFRALLGIVPLDAELVRGSHGKVPENSGDWPVLVLAEYGAALSAQIEAIDVYAALRHFCMESRRPGATPKFMSHPYQARRHYRPVCNRPAKVKSTSSAASSQRFRLPRALASRATLASGSASCGLEIEMHY